MDSLLPPARRVPEQAALHWLGLRDPHRQDQANAGEQVSDSIPSRVVMNLLSDYIAKRDDFSARNRHRDGGLFAPGSPGGPFAFSALVNDMSERFLELMPAMNLAELEALSELAAAGLNLRRMKEAGK